MMNIRSVVSQQVASTATRQTATTLTATNQTMGDVFSQQTDQSKAPDLQQMDTNSLLGMLQSLIQQLMASMSLGSEQQEEFKSEPSSQPPVAPAGGEKSIMDFLEAFIEELLAKLDAKEQSRAKAEESREQAPPPQAAAPQAAASKAASPPPEESKPAEVASQPASKTETDGKFKEPDLPLKVLSSQPTENGGRLDKVKYGTSNQTREYNSDGTMTHKVAFKGDTDKKVNEDFFNDEGVRTKHIQYKETNAQTVGNPVRSVSEYDDSGRLTRELHLGDKNDPSRTTKMYTPEKETTRVYNDNSKNSEFTETRKIDGITLKKP